MSQIGEPQRIIESEPVIIPVPEPDEPGYEPRRRPVEVPEEEPEHAYRLAR